MFPVQILKQTKSKFYTGQGTAGVAAALTAQPDKVMYGVYIRNHDGVNPLFVGNSNVTVGNGFQVVAGESVWIPVEDARDIYVVSGGAVTYSYLLV